MATIEQKGTNEFQPKILRLKATQATEFEISHAQFPLGLTVEADVADPNYAGPIRRMISTMGDPGGGNYPDCFLSITMYGDMGRTLVQFSGRDVHVFDAALSKLDIADAVESFKALVKQLGLSNMVAGILGYMKDEAQIAEWKLPEDQVLRDEAGQLRRSEAGYIQVLRGRFSYHTK